MAHAPRDVHAETLAMIRQVSRELGRPIGTLVDLAGPKIRLGPLPGDAIECAADAEFRFVRGDVPRAPDELMRFRTRGKPTSLQNVRTSF